MTGENTVIEILNKHDILSLADLVVAGIVSDLISHPSDVLQHFVVGFPTGNAILSVEVLCLHLVDILADTVLARVDFRTEFIKMFVFLEKGVICCLQVFHRLSCAIIVPHHAENRNKKVDVTEIRYIHLKWCRWPDSDSRKALACISSADRSRFALSGRKLIEPPVLVRLIQQKNPLGAMPQGDFGAGGRTRTGTLSPAVDFESTTSANSITPAGARAIIQH